MEDFTAEQAEFVTENMNAKPVLKKLNIENAFIYYDEKSRTYKIHTVFLDYLRLNQNLTVEEVCRLYSRLGVWYLGKQEFQRAYGYWNKAGQAERVLSHMNNPQNIRDKLIKFDGAD
ncbi:MAG TPA: LuxR family transcriptional regulator, partial [Bacillota bacterium]|nr:LuxR family transcriptional regulator [Bacillota bacterium]